MDKILSPGKVILDGLYSLCVDISSFGVLLPNVILSYPSLLIDFWKQINLAFLFSLLFVDPLMSARDTQETTFERSITYILNKVNRF